MTKIRIQAVAESCSQDGYKIITMSDFKIITGEKKGKWVAMIWDSKDTGLFQNEKMKLS